MFVKYSQKMFLSKYKCDKYSSSQNFFCEILPTNLKFTAVRVVFCVGPGPGPGLAALPSKYVTVTVAEAQAARARHSTQACTDSDSVELEFSGWPGPGHRAVIKKV